MNPEQENQDPYVSKSQLLKLIANYQQKVKRVRKGSTAVLNHDPKFDSKSLWFPRKVVEELFAANNADGLRIYFGVHDTGIVPTPYDDKLMVVLVATRNEDGINRDQLLDVKEGEEKEVKSLAAKDGKPGYGVNHAIICPPNNC
ncbi:MAG: hypothetical protein EOP47_20830 [Sphingobacteriaceae bacterium]|nr:MAG: hypothetical protein EOP47_20830 [Sphingobacteriaceae bacterium]